MKRNLFFAAMLLLAAGCTSQMPEPSQDAEGNNPFVIRAGFEDPATKSRFKVNSDETFAKVVWTKGDEIAVMDIKGGSYSKRQFRTSEDGVSDAAFTNPDYTPSSETKYTIGFYPYDEAKTNGTYVGVWIPSQQTAVANNIPEGMNKAYAYTTDVTEGLKFKNIPAVIKFKLSGKNVQSLKTIRFVSNAVVAGDCVIQDIDKDEPTFNLNVSFTPAREYPSTSIELTGSEFVAGSDYYIVMLPGTTEGFSMVFLNEDGEYVVRESSKTLTLSRSQILDMGTINIGDTYGDPAVTQYMKATKGTKPVDIVVIPEAFVTKGEANVDGTYLNLAGQAMDFLFDTEPYKTYKDYFNVYFLWKKSAEEGASVSDGKGTIIEPHNTAFGAYWGEESYGDMSADKEKVFSFVASHCPSIVKGERTIDEVAIVMLINDSRYGGICHSTSLGRMVAMVPYTFNGGPITWSLPDQIADDVTGTTFHRSTAELEQVKRTKGDWRNVVLHEFGGHGFGRLLDEYWGDTYPQTEGNIAGHSYTVPFGLNISGHYGTYPWQTLLDQQEMLVDMNELYSRIGVFQGGDEYIFNRWRSEMISCMIDNRPYYSTWQRYLIVKRLFELSGDTFSMESFLKQDNPVDPVRDTRSRAMFNGEEAPVMPPLAPPVVEVID